MCRVVLELPKKIIITEFILFFNGDEAAKAF